MVYVVVCGVAFFAAGLTLFSGFGVGTLLLPAFALFFALDVAVAMTAIVHLTQNLFKLAMFRRHVDRTVALRFGGPALIAAVAGALALQAIASRRGALHHWTLAGHTFTVTLLDLVLGMLVVVVAVFELHPRLRELRGLRLEPRHLPLGGALSGMLGGLSGHQGALRAPFLLQAGLGKEAYIATGTVIASVVDLARLAVYLPFLVARRAELRPQIAVLAGACAAAIAGAYLAFRLSGRASIETVRLVTGVLLAVLGLAMCLGLLS